MCSSRILHPMNPIEKKKHLLYLMVHMENVPKNNLLN